MAKLNGYLEDYAYLIEGLLELYQTTFDPRWSVAAQEPVETMLKHFAGSESTLYNTCGDHQTLITRPRDLQDNATPSGNAMAVTALLKLAGLTDEVHYVDIAHEALTLIQPLLAQYPLGFGQWLQALAYVLTEPREIAIVGDPDSADTQALLSVFCDGYRPFQVVALGPPGLGGTTVPLLQDRDTAAEHAAAYVCRGFAFRTPAREPETLQRLLAV